MHSLLLEYMVSKRETRDGAGNMRRAAVCVLGECRLDYVRNKMKSY